MNTMTELKSLALSGKLRMTPSEALVETLVAQGVTDTFGIVGSAYMDAYDARSMPWLGRRRPTSSGLHHRANVDPVLLWG